jgi:dolichol kinase
MHEFRRQALHFLYGILLLLLAVMGLPWWMYLPLLAVGVLLLKFLPPRLLRRLLEPFDRPRVRVPGWGAFTLTAAFPLTLLLFPRTIALPALLVLVIGDAAATIIGVRYGKHALPWNDRKSYEGSLSFIVTSLIAALFFVKPLVASIAVVVGALAESLPFDHEFLDDNLVIPLLTAFLLFLLGLVFML